MAPASVFEQVIEYSSRADPYRLYGSLREAPVSRQPDGSYVVSTYREIVALLHDPRVSSDGRNLAYVPANQPAPEEGDSQAHAFIRLDPPEHDRIRRLAMYHFGPPHSPGKIDAMRPEMAEIISGLLDGIADRNQADIVEDIAHPFPVIVISKLLGVPREDETRFRAWADAVVEAFGPGKAADRAERQRVRTDALAALREYLSELAQARRERPADDLISGFVTYNGPDGRLSPDEVVSTATLLLIAGHETTVNLITNGVLTLLRHSSVLERLKREPELVIRTVEELLRYEPPVHFPSLRAALDDITIAGTTIPRGAPIVLALAAGSRDPASISDPEQFDPDRDPNQHLGFGGGIHYCFGAPLARLETQVALTEIFSRLENPRLVADPPPYRPSAALRGPRNLQIEFDRVLPRASR